MYRDWPDKPRLAHTQDHTHDTDAESGHGSDSRRQLLWLVVMLWPVTGKAALEEKVVRQRHALVDSKPVTDEDHEGVQDLEEVGVARNSDGDVDGGADAGPDEARHTLGPLAEDLDG